LRGLRRYPVQYFDDEVPPAPPGPPVPGAALWAVCVPPSDVAVGVAMSELRLAVLSRLICAQEAVNAAAIAATIKKLIFM
jgi:hypothetical protein